MAPLLRLAAPFTLCALLAGCATVSESPTQSVSVRTVSNHREVGGVGCILTNDKGRWFVTSPGRIAIRRSVGNLFVDCRKVSEAGDVLAGQETVASRPNQTATIGNAVTTAGLGYLMDKKTGAGWDYPDPLTVILKSAPKTAAPQQDGPSGTTVY